MQIVNDLVYAAQDENSKLADVLRKCLVVATKLKNEHLKAWVLAELNGYAEIDSLPEYRVLNIRAKGVFFGAFQYQLNNQPLPSSILEESHRHWATTAYLKSGIAGYEGFVGKPDTKTLQIEWPTDMVLYYQEKFFDELVLNRAWQEIPISAIEILVDTVRTRLLQFALEIQAELETSDNQLEDLPIENIEQTVTNIIFSGNTTIADNIVGNINQTNEINVIQGDFVSLTKELKKIGVQDDEIELLRLALEEDENKEDNLNGLGRRTSEWLGKAVVELTKRGGQIATNIATSALTTVVMRYLGLS